MLILYLLTSKMSEEQMKQLKRPIYIMEAGIVFTIVNMFVIGVYEVVGMGAKTINMSAINGIIGLGHITLAIGLVWTITKLFNLEKTNMACAIAETTGIYGFVTGLLLIFVAPGMFMNFLK